MSFAFSPTRKALCDSFEPWQSKSTKIGSKPTVTSTWKCCANSARSSNSWRPPKVNATAYSQTGCSGLAPAPELCPYGAPAAATSPPAFMNKPYLFPSSYRTSFLLNLTHVTPVPSLERPGALLFLDIMSPHRDSQYPTINHLREK